MHYPLLEHTNPPKEAELCANVYQGPSDTRDQFIVASVFESCYLDGKETATIYGVR